MLRTNRQSSNPRVQTKWAVVARALLLAAAEALGQEKQTIQGSQARLIAEQGSQPARWIVVNIPDRKLALVEDGRVLRIYPVAVGAAISPSPSGEFKIAHRISQPTYYHPGVIIPPGKANPLGTRWLGLSQKGYGIHGTNQPRSIGRRASHGCIRMRNRDIEELFELVRVGDVVELYAYRTAALAEIFGVSRMSAAKAPPPTPLAVAEAGSEAALD